MRSEKIQSLQGYRAVAAVLVVLFHVTLYSRDRFGLEFLGNVFGFGYMGVDFFFVLSGFIIFYRHSGDMGERARIAPYVKRRLIRIFPIYWLVTSAKVLLILLVPTIALGYERDLAVLVKSYLLVPQPNPPVIGAAWTLSYELFFYLLFAMFIWSGPRFARWLFAGWVLAIVMFYGASRTGFLPASVGGWAWTWVVFHEFNFEFMLGCLSAYLVLHYRLKYPGVIMVVGMFLFVLSARFARTGDPVPSYALMFGVPCFLIVLGSALLELGRKLRVPGSILYVGDASYSIYLTHVLFITIYLAVLDRTEASRVLPLPIAVGGMVVVALVGGILVYQFVEKPMLDYLRKKLLGAHPDRAAAASPSTPAAA